MSAPLQPTRHGTSDIGASIIPGRLIVALAVLVAVSGCGGGGGAATAASPPAAAAPTAPGAPTSLSATPGDTQATIAFSAPSSDGGSAITGYSGRCAAAGASVTGTATSSPVTVSGLVNGTLYSCTVNATNAQGSGADSAAVSVTPVAAGSGSGSSFALASPVAAEGGVLPAEHTCDGSGASPALTWTNVPAGTQAFALLMSTLPGDGSTKYNWVLRDIPGTARSLSKSSFGVGIAGVGSDGPMAAYQPPCSQGPGAKVYTFTLFALSAAPSVSGTVDGTTLRAALAAVTLDQAMLNVTYTRTAASPGSSTACQTVRGSMAASTTGHALVSCDATYAYVASEGLATHTMMDGITATNLQVPTTQNFFGANAWRIPLAPAIAATPTSAVDGPIGIAVNGVPIFNPCKQGGCQNGDTKVLGELDVCNGHAGRADDYHYHAAPLCLMAGKPASYWDTHPLGWALDGFAIFGYNNADGTPASRDGICGGNTSTVPNAPAGYSYHVTDASPYVLSCLRGTPSPDLAGQGAKYAPMRQPPVTPFAVSGMTLTTDPVDGYQVLQFSSARSFTTTETGADSYANAPGTYRIRYRRATGAALDTLLAQPAHRGKTACWTFQFTTGAGAGTQPDVAYCR